MNNGMFGIHPRRDPPAVGIALGSWSALTIRTRAIPSTDKLIQITCGEILLTDAAGGILRLENIHLTPQSDYTYPDVITINGGIGGENGLDKGAIAAGWYNIFVISTADGGRVRGLLSTGATPQLPGGYTHWSRVGAARYDSGGGIFVTFRQVGNFVATEDLVIFNSPRAGNTIYAQLAGAELTQFQLGCPPLARAVALTGGAGSASNSDDEIRVASHVADPGGGGETVLGERFAIASHAAVLLSGVYGGQALNLPLWEHNLWLKMRTAGTNNRLAVAGWWV